MSNICHLLTEVFSFNYQAKYWVSIWCRTVFLLLQGFFAVVFLMLPVFFWGHDIIISIIIIINCFFSLRSVWHEDLHWLGLKTKAELHVVHFFFCAADDYDCVPEATGTARITFQSLVRTSLAIDFDDCNSGVQTTAWKSSLVVGCLPKASWCQW